MHIDLSGNAGLTTALIAHPLDWRVRAVERLEIETATSCLRRRSLQAAPLRPLLPRGLGEGATTALVVLNVASVPRGALLDLDVYGPEDSPAFLLPRSEIARREADYLRAVAEDVGLVVGVELHVLLQAVLGHTKTRWKIDTESDLMASAAEYLDDGFGRQIPPSTLAEWLRLDANIAAALAPYAETFKGLSPTEHPLVGLPSLSDLVDLDSPEWCVAVTAVLVSYLSLVEAAADLARPGEPSAAHDLLASLTDYGRNYDMLVATTVPLDEPFLIKYSERRPLDFSVPANRGQQDLVINDAGSNHVLLAVNDPNVRIKTVTAWAAGHEDKAFGAFTTTQTPQTYAVYAHDEDRDYRIILDFVLAPLRRLQYTIYLAAALLVLLAGALVYEQPRRLQDVALIVGPSALAASVLLNREPSTLGSRLRGRSTLVLSASVSLLLIVGTLSYIWPALSALASRLT